ncbi:uncharacterized protein EV420DRAFT_1650429 [Desarmillaria tabescens]|uniref:Uncharacterized protein n=1 Tax=Armillaria tabescens TaxID=1929756 RepID=A0AA39JDB0_ARMTA|nr:uncharacterized protein EV420DRAFT_1650429 [Desarmillaria tabescens]KAK0440680.1 hypothetical protein EV420DRAFT_1650429 [Desarmillaria tabescens]
MTLNHPGNAIELYIRNPGGTENGTDTDGTGPVVASQSDDSLSAVRERRGSGQAIELTVVLNEHRNSEDLGINVVNGNGIFTTSQTLSITILIAAMLVLAYVDTQETGFYGCLNPNLGLDTRQTPKIPSNNPPSTSRLKYASLRYLLEHSPPFPMVIYTYDETVYAVSVTRDVAPMDSTSQVTLFKFGREDSPVGLPSLGASERHSGRVTFIDLDREEAVTDATEKVAPSLNAHENNEHCDTSIGDTSRRTLSRASRPTTKRSLDELGPYLWEFENLSGDPAVGSNITRNEAKFGDAKKAFAYYYTSGEHPLDIPPQDRLEGSLKPGDIFLHRVTNLDKYQIFLYRDNEWVMRKPGEDSHHPESSDRILVLRGSHAYPTWVKPESDRSYREKQAREAVPGFERAKRHRSNSRYGTEYSPRKLR